MGVVNVYIIADSYNALDNMTQLLVEKDNGRSRYSSDDPDEIERLQSETKMIVQQYRDKRVSKTVAGRTRGNKYSFCIMY